MARLLGGLEEATVPWASPPSFSKGVIMPNEQKFCFKVTIGFKDMDMSGGDNVDGPRWTGKWTDEQAILHVVATTEALAKAGALSMFYENSKAAVKICERLNKINLIVEAF